MIHEAYMPVNKGSRFSLRTGRWVRDSTRGPLRPKKRHIRIQFWCGAWKNQLTSVNIQFYTFTDQLPAAEVIEPQKTSLSLRQDLSVLCEVLQKAEPMCPFVVVPWNKPSLWLIGIMGQIDSSKYKTATPHQYWGHPCLSLDQGRFVISVSPCYHL